MTYTKNSCGNVFSHEVIEILSELQSANVEMINNAISKLKSLKTKADREILNALNHKDSEIRSQAVELLLILDPDNYFDRILPLMEDPVDFVRLNLLNCIVLSKFYDPRIVGPVIKVLMKDPDVDVRALAAAILGNTGDPSAIPALKWATDHDFDKDYEGVTVSHIADKSIEKINQAN